MKRVVKRKVNARPAAKRLARRRKNPDAISTFAQLAGGIASAMHINEMISKKKPARKSSRKSAASSRHKKNPLPAARKVKNPVSRAAMAARMAKVRAARKTNGTKAAKRNATGVRASVPARRVVKRAASNPKRAGRMPALQSANPRKQVRVPAKGDFYLLTIGSGDDVMAVYLQDGDKDGFSKRFKTVAAAKAYATKKRMRLSNPPAKVLKNPDYYFATRERDGSRVSGVVRALTAAGARRKVRKNTRSKAKVTLRRANPKARVGTRASLPARTLVKAASRNPRRLAGRDARVPARKRNAAPKIPRRRTFEMFNGRKVERVTPLRVSKLAPANGDQLGGLVELKLMGSNQVYKFNPTRVRLVASHGRLWIAGKRFANPAPSLGERVVNPIAEIDHVVYTTHKPHHDDPPGQHYIHKLGEWSGRRPVLCVDREGYPVIRGGNYKIEARGIVD